MLDWEDSVFILLVSGEERKYHRSFTLSLDKNRNEGFPDVKKKVF